MAAGVWQGEPLPGEWREEGHVGPSRISHLMARPRLFGREVLLLRAVHREDRLAWLEATFVDAGSYFGYLGDDLPEGLSGRQLEEEIGRRVEFKQERFAEEYEEGRVALREAIAAVAERERPKEVRFGRGRLLRAEPEEWRREGLAIRLFDAPDRLVRVTIFREGEGRRGWMDPALEKEGDRERLERVRANSKSSRAT